MKIIQVLPTFSYGDAVGNDVLAMRRILLDAGYKTCIYAENIGPRIPRDGVYNIQKEWREPDADDIIIYHMSIGWKHLSLISSAKCRKIAVYHNITPAKFFSRYNSAAFRDCRYGLNQVRSARDVFDYVLADSEFNKHDLQSYGYTCPIDVLPILIPYKDYEKRPSEKVIARYRKKSGHTIVFVGRVAPNKCLQDVIASFALYKRYFDSDAHLVFVGGHGRDAYYSHLESYIAALDVDDVTFTNHIPFAEILAYYSVADAFVCMSEHEGFCVPLVEAMLFDVPIIAYDSTAVGDTLGAGGLLVGEKDPLMVAGAIDRVVNDAQLQARIRAGQQQQLRRFSYSVVRDQFLAYLRAFDERALMGGVC